MFRIDKLKLVHSYKDNKFNCIIKMSNEINISMCFYISVANGDVYDLIHVNA